MADVDMREYRLGRGFAETSRLHYNHMLLKEAIGYNLSPSIPLVGGGTKDKASLSLRIADVATGNGIWPCEVARELPNCQVDGFDVSDAQFPPAEWLPRNVHLGTFDGAGKLPDELKGKYDIVAVRLIMPVVANRDIAPWVNNFLAMLKPGGYLQWVEYNPDEKGVRAVDPENVRERFQTVFKINEATAAAANAASRPMETYSSNRPST
ncbi:hypothetical protein BDY21DRAFT_69032 [Lineolata rhizophorae]|uniref:Methyltransferase domain-containing protein n=1 Tax=Lineolata rhizophorae TaxID=578093 RepID=A0A6A6NV74_9PEZI|nr:hypothetical protein BDY21DRAFT_69032 [Lineolata rhizophorae]